MCGSLIRGSERNRCSRQICAYRRHAEGNADCRHTRIVFRKCTDVPGKRTRPAVTAYRLCCCANRGETEQGGVVLENTGNKAELFTNTNEEITDAAAEEKSGRLFLSLLIVSAIGAVILSALAISGAVRENILRRMQDAANTQTAADLSESETAALSAPVDDSRDFSDYLQSVIHSLPRVE